MRGKGILLGVALALALSAAPAVAQAGDSSISGTVTDSSGESLADVCVDADKDLSWEWGSATTGADGTYRIDDLVAGEYTIYFSPCARPSPYLSEWYDDKPDWESADRVPVADGAEVSGINAALTRRGSITGTVTNEQGDPLGEICVFARSEDWEWGGYADTSPDGRYAIAGLPSGGYRVHFQDCGQGLHLPEWYDNKQRLLEADLVPVVEEATTADINAALALGGSIAGQVTGEQGQPLEGICVDAYDPSGDWVSSAETDDRGRYRVTELPAGAYKIEFTDCDWDWYRTTPPYLPEWYDDKEDLDTADPVEVVAGVERNGIDAQLAPAPAPDLALSALSVEPERFRTDVGDLAPNPLRKRVHVGVSNLGEADAEDAELEVWACTRSDEKCQDIGSALVSVPAGGEQSRSFQWNAAGTAGDVTVFARVCGDDDTDPSNNGAEIDHFVLVDGSGAGVTLRASSSSAQDPSLTPCERGEDGFFFDDEPD